MDKENPPILYTNVLDKTIKRMEAISTLRTQKLSPALGFTPSRAYVILGHGTQLNTVFRVPENCIIIVKAHPGESLYYHNIVHLWNKLYNPSRRLLYENPLVHLYELINDFGSIMIYKAGDICPNFVYALGPEYDTELNLIDNRVVEGDNDTRNLSINKFGLIPLDDRYTYIHPSDVPINMPVKQFVESFYSNSIVPSIDDFKEHLGEENYNTKTLREMINSKDDTSDILFPDNYWITQKDLLNIDPVTGKAGRTGVYYNFVCRDIFNTTNTYYAFNQGLGKDVIRPTIQNYYTTLNGVPTNKGVRNIIERKIVEAEQRKHFIPGSKYNKLATTRRRKSRKQQRTRKSRK